MAESQIEQIRNSYPQYSDWTDEQLQNALETQPLLSYRLSRPEIATESKPKVAFEMWRSNYSPEVNDQRPLPMGLYADEIGLTDDEFGEMLGIAQQSGFPITRSTDDVIREQGGVPDYPIGLARAGKFGRGLTLGVAENVAAHGAAVTDEVMGAIGVGHPRRGELSYSENVAQHRRPINQLMDDYQRDRPVESTAIEIGGGFAGAVTNPAAGAKGLYNFLNIGSKGLKGKTLYGLGMSGTTGGMYGYMTAEGTPAERLDEATSLILPSMLFGAGGQVIIGGGSKVLSSAVRNLSERFVRTAQAPTRDGLKNLVTKAYAHAGSLNLRIPGDRFERIGQEARRKLRVDAGLLPENLTREGQKHIDGAWQEVLRAVSIVERGMRPGGMSATQFETTRKLLWKKYNQVPKNSEQSGAILDLIKKMDDVFEEVPQLSPDWVDGSAASQAWKAAREANRRYRNFVLLEDAFEQAERGAAVTGTGGNVMNKYLQAVNNIINSEKKSQFFKPHEIEMMKEFIKLDSNQEFMRLIGRLSPDANGLMTAFNVGAAFVDPALLAVSGGAMAARRGSENITQRRGEDLMRFIADPDAPPLQSAGGIPTPYSIGTGVADTQTAQDEERDEQMTQLLNRQRSRGR